MKKSNKLKNYMYTSITLLSFAIYIVFFPLISKLLNLISPNLTKCPYLEITGKPCPLCGGTRYIAGLYNVFTDITYLFSFFGAIIVFVFFEIIFRIMVIINLNKTKKVKRGIVIFDIVIHILAFVLFLLYEIIYLINN